jgi:hypothetical protein
MTLNVPSTWLHVGQTDLPLRSGSKNDLAGFVSVMSIPSKLVLSEPLTGALGLRLPEVWRGLHGSGFGNQIEPMLNASFSRLLWGRVGGGDLRRLRGSADHCSGTNGAGRLGWPQHAHRERSGLSGITGGESQRCPAEFRGTVGSITMPECWAPQRDVYTRALLAAARL